MRPWLWIIENELYNFLIRSPGFHRGVQAVEKKVRQIRHGKDFEEMGGTKLDGEKGVFQHFVDELKGQSPFANKSIGNKSTGDKSIGNKNAGDKGQQ